MSCRGGSHGFALVLVGLLVACSSPQNGIDRPRFESVGQWYDALAQHCGQAFEGRVVTASSAAEAEVWRQASPRLFFRSCEQVGMVLPIARGEDRSLTLLLGRVDAEGSLRLRHVLHGPDGEPAELTGYGGVGRYQAADAAVEFPLDDALKELYLGQGMNDLADSTWVLRQEADLLVYEQRSGTGRLYVEFDLSRPVETPEASWMEQPIR